MGSESYIAECPYCGFAGAWVHREGSYYTVRYCTACGWREFEAEDGLWGEFADSVSQNHPELDPDKDYDKWSEKVREYLNDYLESEGGSEKIPTNKDIKRAKEYIKILKIAVPAHDYESDDYLDFCYENDLINAMEEGLVTFRKAIIEALFNE